MASLYTYPDFWRSYPVLIGPQYSGVQLKVPAFEGEKGFHIHESNAIAHYDNHAGCKTMKVSDMFQHLERLRKNGFAIMAVFGKDGDDSISGVWLFRGQQLAFEDCDVSQLCDDWKVDYGSYSWRKLDPDGEESKTLMKEYLCWEGEFKHVGKPFNQGKIFK